MLWIRHILVRIRTIVLLIRIRIRLRTLLFLWVSFKMPTKNKFFFLSFYYYCTYWGCIYTSLQRLHSHKEATKQYKSGSFLLCCVMREVLVSVQIMTDPGGPKTYESYGTGSTTLPISNYAEFLLSFSDGFFFPVILTIHPVAFFLFTWSESQLSSF
jgi:hypothetical protein